MVRYLAVFVAMLASLGCREQPPAAKPAGGGKQTDVPSINGPELAQDSFRLAIDDVRPDVRSDVDAGRRVFTISVPSSAKRIRVVMGPVDKGSSWSLNLEPTSETERICTFEVSQPVVVQKESSRYVTVTCKLTTPTSTSESPLGFSADETIDLEEVVSYADSAKVGLHKLNSCVVLGHLKLDVPKAVPLTLLVMSDETDSADE